MSLSSVIDAGQKTGDHGTTFSSAKRILHNINNLFETLLSVTKREYHKIEKKELDIVPLMEAMKNDVEKNYADKQITCALDIPKTYTLNSNEDVFRIIFSNLLQNAFKYTDE
jgi:signal transduction histidine kinase